MLERGGSLAAGHGGGLVLAEVVCSGRRRGHGRGEVAAAAGGGDLEHLPIRAAHFRSDSIRLPFQKTP